MRGVVGIVAVVVLQLRLHADDPNEFFERHIRPVLHEQCRKCHGPEKQKAGLRVDSREALLRGGDSGPALVPGDPEASLLIKAVRHSLADLKMPPPTEAPKLAAEVLADLEAWVKAGAFFPVTTVASPGSKHWAFQPVHKPAVHALRGVNPVDAFLGTTNAPSADPRRLIRRMTYDLTGLPPSPEEVDEFAQSFWKSDSAQIRDEAINQLLDRLLASPAYGERWGRKWLDVVRYADTAGENTDRPLRDAWRYRNYVIAAYNHDTPYDQFVREQIAGDLLAAADPRQYAQLIPATGYLAIARRFGHDIDKDMHLTYEDVIDTLGKSVLGLSLGCARCHNHKYDPVTTRDYYGLYGIFSSTKFAYPGCEPNQKVRDMVPLWTPDEMASKRKPFDDQLVALDSAIKKIKASQTERWNTMRQALTNPPTFLAAAMTSDNGGQAAPLCFSVKVGDMVRLSIESCEPSRQLIARVEFLVEVGDGGQAWWNLSTDVLGDFLDANPHGDRYGQPATWCFLDARKPLEVLTDTVRDFEGKKGLHLWRHGDGPAAFVNASDVSLTAWSAILPPHSLFLRTAPDGPVGVAWISPISRNVRLSCRVTDVNSGGTGGMWKLEHFAMNIGAPMTEIAGLNEELQRSQQTRAELVAREPKVPLAYAVTEGNPADAPLQKRGDPDQPGEIIPRKNLDLLGGQRTSDPKASGRSDLARWLTDPTNSLTARVMVNRIWQGHFGCGIVATPNDFGARGAPPTYPQLLDWLAATFVEKGWSIKAMHRLIMTSSAYRQAGRDSAPFSSNGRPSKPQASPDSPPLVSRPFHPFPSRRLEAEEIRDTLLALSGELDRESGEGHPFPPETATFTQHTPFKAIYESRKRSVYLMTQRIQRHPFLALFDGPDTNASTAERGLSTVPTQALFFMNDPFFHAAAEAFSKQLLKSPAAGRVRLAHRLCFQREPSESERADAVQFLEAYRAELNDLGPEQRDLAAWSAYARTLLASNELLYLD
jgi:hypothetical protein